MTPPPWAIEAAVQTWVGVVGGRDGTVKSEVDFPCCAQVCLGSVMRRVEWEEGGWWVCVGGGNKCGRDASLGLPV